MEYLKSHRSLPESRLRCKHDPGLRTLPRYDHPPLDHHPRRSRTRTSTLSPTVQVLSCSSRPVDSLTHSPSPLPLLRSLLAPDESGLPGRPGVGVKPGKGFTGPFGDFTAVEWPSVKCFWGDRRHFHLTSSYTFRPSDSSADVCSTVACRHRTWVPPVLSGFGPSILNRDPKIKFGE